jgi:hypothetical protein
VSGKEIKSWTETESIFEEVIWFAAEATSNVLASK